MTFSTLVNGWQRADKKSSPRPAGTKINGLDVHHWAGFQPGPISPNNPASSSANYWILSRDTPGVGKDGDLIGSVSEDRIAWTSGGKDRNGKGVSAVDASRSRITVEIQNLVGDPVWSISVKAEATLKRLIQDLDRRYPDFKIDRKSVRGHREVPVTATTTVATACPGPYVFPRLDQWVQEAAGPKVVAPTPAPKPPTPAPTPPAPVSLNIGSKGARVTALQTGLNRTFPSYSKLKVDGVYGVATANVVREFQRRSKLVVDGVCGPQTIAALAKHGVKV